MAEANQNKTFVWRDTLSDGFLPFREFTTAYSEMTKKNIKESQLFEEKNQTLVKTFGDAEIFNASTGQKFSLKDWLYCKKLKAYVYPRKYDEEKRTYQCR